MMAILTGLFQISTLPEESAPSKAVKPLSKALANEELILVEISARRRLTHRLAELGLTPGVKLRVVQVNGGPLLVSVRGSRIAIGRGMAEKVMVIPAE
jgi:ferrous iron transport protein A